MKLLHLLLPLSLALLAGCTKNIQNNDAVRQGVINHLSQNKGLAVTSMDIEVSSVTFKDNEAEATVSFKPKGAAASSGMQMRYTLEKKGTEWVVKKKADSGMGHAVGAPGGMPGAMPPAMGGDASAMPPGHPPAGMGKAAEPKK